MRGVLTPEQRFRAAYAEQRASEGRGYLAPDLQALPYLASGPPALVRQWEVRARTFEAFCTHTLLPAMRRAGRPLHLLDLGAGTGWLGQRAARAGCRAVALDLRSDDVDGLGAARRSAGAANRCAAVVASFAAIPLADASMDLVVFNASLHYATDLAQVLGEARRVTRAGGTLAILDSPFYRREDDGLAMVAEKHANAARDFGARAEALLALPFIEFLTRRRLAAASASLGLAWRRQRVRYPLWYELRPLKALLGRRRTPSRFDYWECTVA